MEMSNDSIEKFLDGAKLGETFDPKVIPTDDTYKKLFDEMAQEIEEETRLKDEDEEDTPNIIEVVKLAKEKLKEKKDE